MGGPAANEAGGGSGDGGRRVGGGHVRWVVYLLIGALAGAGAGAWLVLVLLGCGLVEVAVRLARRPPPHLGLALWAKAAPLASASGGGVALAWVALKVGALSYGGGFVIVPLMQHDAVNRYHWMTAAQFLDAVALGQITPGPVVLTVSVVGFAAAGVAGGLLAAAVAFAPSFGFILVGGRRFDRIRTNRSASAFLTGAGPAAIGAIAGASLPLALALQETWQLAVLAAALVGLMVARRAVPLCLLAAAVCGTAAALLGAAVPR